MELRLYLNSLEPEAQADFAARCGTTVGYLRKAISKEQLLGPALCVSIERESKGKVTRPELRNTDWKAIWPELAKAA